MLEKERPSRSTNGIEKHKASYQSVRGFVFLFFLERHAYAAAPDAAVVGKGIVLLVEDVVDAEVGAELVVEFLRNDEVHESERRVFVNGAGSHAASNPLRIAVAGDPVLPERCVPAVPRVVIAELEACLVAGTPDQPNICLVVMRIKVGVETRAEKIRCRDPAVPPARFPESLRCQCSDMCRLQARAAEIREGGL